MSEQLQKSNMKLVERVGIYDEFRGAHVLNGCSSGFQRDFRGIFGAEGAYPTCWQSCLVTAKGNVPASFGVMGSPC